MLVVVCLSRVVHDLFVFCLHGRSLSHVCGTKKNGSIRMSQITKGFDMPIFHSIFFVRPGKKDGGPHEVLHLVSQIILLFPVTHFSLELNPT